MISKASAPGKIILFGEHFVVHGTEAILAAIDRRITVTSEAIDGQVIRIESELGDEEVGIPDAARTPELRPFAFIAKKMIREFSHRGGIRIRIESDIPHGVGLGSSSASCVAAAASVAGLFARRPRGEICRLAIEAEKTIFEDTSGADCTVCTFGGIITYGRNSGFEKIGFEPSLQLVVSDSETTHSTGEVVAGVSKYREDNMERFEDLCRRESGLIDRAKRQIQGGGPRQIGESMRENQRYLEEIGVSSQTLQRMIGLADMHSFGSKITGAGGGGCIISITDEASLGHTIKALRENRIKSFGAKIDYSGLETF